MTLLSVMYCSRSFLSAHVLCLYKRSIHCICSVVQSALSCMPV